MINKDAVGPVFDRIRSEDVVQLARQMIAIPSPNFEEGRLTEFMVERMRSLGLEVTTMDVEHPIQAGKKTRQAVGRLKGKGGGPTLMINGHLDVNVEMPGWTVHPTEGKFEDGWIGAWVPKTIREVLQQHFAGSRRLSTRAPSSRAMSCFVLWRLTSLADGAHERS